MGGAMANHNNIHDCLGFRKTGMDPTVLIGAKFAPLVRSQVWWWRHCCGEADESDRSFLRTILKLPLWQILKQTI